MTKVLLMGLAMLLAGNCYADAYSKVSTIKNMTVGLGFARVELLDNTGGFEACSTERQWYYLDLSVTTPGVREMYAALLAAKASGQQVILQLAGCAGDYSKINHIYLCERASCL